MWSLVGVAVLAGLYLSMFFLPYPMFGYHAEFAGFSVYSDQTIPNEFGPLMDEARRRIEKMELYRGGGDLRVFVCNSQRLFAALNRLAGKRRWGQALVISAAGNAFFSVSGIESVARRYGGRIPHSRLEGSWAAAVAHEAAHAQVHAELGTRRARELPVWKSEGHADYSANLLPIATDPGYDLYRRVRWVLDDTLWRDPAGPMDRRHFRWQVLVEFLSGVEGMSFHQLLEDSVTEESAWADLMEWYSASGLESSPAKSRSLS
jgi:hypothetical protein